MTSDPLRPSKGEIQVRSEYFGPDVGKREHRTTDRLAGPFKIGALLGRGITGSVRVGVHIDTGFQVALKCVKKKYLKEKEERWNTFRREMAVMKMMDHPHIIKLYDVFESSSRIYLVCEYVKGGELFDYISTNGLPKEEALRLFAQILLAIQHAHDYGIVHRDLKPENILLDEEKNIKIGDFGMARFIKDGILLHTSCGSPHYTSPEVIAGSYDGRISDVWSLGVIFYAMVSGCLPFNDENLSVMFELIQAGNFDIPPEVDPDCQDLIREMLQVDASKRIRIEDISNHRAFRGTSYFPAPFRSYSGLSPSASPGSISSCSSPLSSPGLDPLVSPKYAFASLKLPPSLSTTSLPSSPMGSPRSVDSFRFEGKLDSGLIEDMLSLGTWGSREEITTRLQEPENNQEKGIYRLLSERKKSRLDELSRLSPRRVSRSLLPRISSVPSIHKSSSLATSSEYRETLPEFDLPPIRDDSPTSSYTDSPRSVGRSPSPRTPRRIDLRVQIAKARKAKLDPESSPVVKQKQSSASASPRVSPPPKSESPKLFSHPLPEFITTDDIRSLQPYIQSHPSPTTTPSRKGSSGPMSDEVFAASLSQILKQLATTTHSSSPVQTKSVARAFFPKSGSREDDKQKTMSGSLKFKERQGELTPRPEEKEYSKESTGRLSTSTSSRRSSTSSVDADSFQDSPTLPRRTLQPALDATPTQEKSGKRSTKLPPKKSVEPSPTASPVPSGSSSPILQWFSSFFRRRPSLDPWAKVGGGVKDPASTRYQARTHAKNRSTFIPKPLPTPPSTSSKSSQLPPPPPPMSGITLLSAPTTDMVTSLSYEEKSDTVPLPTVHRAMSLPLDGTEEAKLRSGALSLPLEETIKARSDSGEESRDRAKTSEHPIQHKARHRPQRSGSLPMSISIESERKQRKRQSVQRTPRTPSAESSVPSSPSLQVPTKKSFFGRYRRLKPADFPTSPQSVTTTTVTTSTSLSSLTSPSPRTGASEDSSVLGNFFKPKKTPTKGKRNKSHELLKKYKRHSLEDSSDLGYQIGTKSAPGSALSTPQSSPALGPLCNPPDVTSLSISGPSSSTSTSYPRSGSQLDKNFDQDGDLVMF